MWCYVRFLAEHHCQTQAHAGSDNCKYYWCKSDDSVHCYSLFVYVILRRH
jgi:hypothetical protein